MDLHKSDLINMQSNGITIVEAETDELELLDTTLILRYHQQFGHILFKRLQDVAKTRVFPKRLSK